MSFLFLALLFCLPDFSHVMFQVCKGDNFSFFRLSFPWSFVINTRHYLDYCVHKMGSNSFHICRAGIKILSQLKMDLTLKSVVFPHSFSLFPSFSLSFFPVTIINGSSFHELVRGKRGPPFHNDNSFIPIHPHAFNVLFSSCVYYR